MATQLRPTNPGPFTTFQNETVEWPANGGITVAITADNLPDGTDVDHFITFDPFGYNYSDDIDALDVYDSTFEVYLIPNITPNMGIGIYFTTDK